MRAQEPSDECADAPNPAHEPAADRPVQTTGEDRDPHVALQLDGGSAGDAEEADPVGTPATSITLCDVRRDRLGGADH